MLHRILALEDQTRQFEAAVLALVQKVLERLDALEQRIAAMPPPPREPSGCMGDILAVLRAAGGPLTTAGVLDALAKAGKEWSESTVRHTLAAAVDAGILANTQGKDSKGYILPHNRADVAG